VFPLCDARVSAALPTARDPLDFTRGARITRAKRARPRVPRARHPCYREGMHVESFPVGPLGCNCSIVADLESKTAIVVDPGGDLEKIRGRLDARGLSVTAIVHTHTHIDHVGATAGLQRATGAAAKIHEADRFLYDLLPVQAAMLGVPLPEKTDMDGSLVDGFTLRAGALEMGVLHTPGHTPGSVCFVVASGGSIRVFTGDTLFRRGIGRTDLWGGDSAQIDRSLRGKLLTLADDALVVPGHGPNTTIGEERRQNPFLTR
jgi:glyoxylase-like metal-dependent hydrolase (beta-lactamase superfamily II)